VVNRNEMGNLFLTCENRHETFMSDEYNHAHMSEAGSAGSTDAPRLRAARRLPLYACLLACLSGCTHMGCDIRKQNFGAARTGTRLAVFSFDNDDDQATAPYEVNLGRVRRGYELAAPLYEGGDTKASMTMSRTRDLHWFVGPHLSFNF
jgi:hypothetical protein